MKYIASCSFGKDSLAMVLMAMQLRPEKMPPPQETTQL